MLAYIITKKESYIVQVFTQYIHLVYFVQKQINQTLHCDIKYLTCTDKIRDKVSPDNALTQLFNDTTFDFFLVDFSQNMSRNC